MLAVALGCGGGNLHRGWIVPSNACSNPAVFLTDAGWGAGLQTVARHASQAVVRFVATKTTERISVVTTFSDGTPDLNFAVYQNAAYLSTFACTFNASSSPQFITITGLTVGATIDIVEPSQGPSAVVAGAKIEGSYVLALFDSTPVRVAPSRSTVIYGNSYMGGYGATAPDCANGVPAGIRAYHPDGAPGVFVRQWSSNGYLVFSDATHETAAQQAQALVDLSRGTTKEIAIIALGRNDWLYNSGTAAQVATRSAAICDAVHASDSSIKILLAVVWLTLSETANGSGQTLPQYRAAELAVASGRSWVTGLDLSDPAVMPTWNTGTDLYDDSHPNSLGYGKIATAIRANLPLGAI